MLFWLEALGVSKFIGEAYMALISVEGWLQVSLFMCDTGYHPSNTKLAEKNASVKIQSA